jgi:hypothetical protein
MVIFTGVVPVVRQSADTITVNRQSAERQSADLIKTTIRRLDKNDNPPTRLSADIQKIF